MNIRTFILYKDWYALIQNLSNEDAGILIKLIFHYQNYGYESITNYIEATEKKELVIIFEILRNQFLIDEEKYLDKKYNNTNG